MENNDEDDTFDNAKNKNGAPLRATTTTTTTKATTRYEKKIKNQRAQHLGKKGFVIVEADEDLYADLSHPEQVKDERDALEDLKNFHKSGTKGDNASYCYLLPAGNEVESTTNCGIKLRYHSQWAMAITYESIDKIKKMIVAYLNNDPIPTSKEYKRCMVLLHAIVAFSQFNRRDI